MTKTKYEHYYIECVSDNVYKVYSDKTGVLKELKQSQITNNKRANAKPYIQVRVDGCQLLHRLVASTFMFKAFSIAFTVINDLPSLIKGFSVIFSDFILIFILLNI